MAYQIRKIIVDGVTFTGVEFTGTDQETVAIGVAEATVTAAVSSQGTGPSWSGGTVTTVASPTTYQSVGVGRGGIDYSPKGRWERCAVSGMVFHIREMLRQRGAWVSREDYDQRIPIRGRTGQVPSRRWAQFGGF